MQASSLGAKLPGITPNAKCKLRLLKLERVKDWLLMEEEFVSNQERLKPQEERNEEERTKVCIAIAFAVALVTQLDPIAMTISTFRVHVFAQVDELRGSPMSVGSLEEIIDEKCVPSLCS